MKCAVFSGYVYYMNLKHMHSKQDIHYWIGKAGSKCSICIWETNGKKQRRFKNCNKEGKIERKQDKWKKQVRVSRGERIFKSTCWQMVLTGAWSFGIFAPKCSWERRTGRKREMPLSSYVSRSLFFILSFSFNDCFHSCGAPLTGWLL